MTGYWELALSRWSYNGPNGRTRAWLGQLSVKPVFRYTLPTRNNAPWFIEVGVGASLTTVLYQTDTKRFSTRFNFGDQIAFGRCLMAGCASKLSLRIEHFSNGGIRQPNPGENFVQLRYLQRF